VELRKSALGSEQGKMTLTVSSTVPLLSEWGERGLAGYSSSGRLTNSKPDGPNDLEVSVVAGDIDLALDQPIGVVKLDLQGGEEAAIEGLSSTLESSVHLCWVEFLPRYTRYSLMERLEGLGFEIFDTEYVFKGDPDEGASRLFKVVSTSKVSSSGTRRWRGIPIKEWVDYESQFEEARKKFGLLQTDLLCARGEFADMIRSSYG
jgi:FkbM family methyltransferase